MPNKITSSRKVKKPFQILAETTEGQLPTTGTFTAIPTKTIEIEKDGQYTPVEQIGPEDFLDLVRGNPRTTIRTTSPMLDTALEQRLINPANDSSPAGTVSESLTALFSMLVDVGSGLTETYFEAVGVRPKSGQVKFDKGKPHEIQVVWSVLDWLAPTTSAPVGPTLASAFPSGTVYRHKDMTANAFQWNSTAMPITTMTINVDRGTEPDDILGQEVPYGQQPYTRDIKVTFSMLYLASALITDFNSDTSRTYSIQVASGKTITGTARLTKPKIPIDASAKGAVPQEWEMQLLTATAS